jgi:prepilin-type processing-associated H-X9-DG protein
VSLGTISNTASTILGTEWIGEWGIVSGTDRANNTGLVADKPHRPIQAWRAGGPAAWAFGVGQKDKATSGNYVDPTSLPSSILLRKTTAIDFYNVNTSQGNEPGIIVPDPGAGQSYGINTQLAVSNGTNNSGLQTLEPITDYGTGNYDRTGKTRATQLDWVGRNHNIGDHYVDNKTNFLYADGHVETKSILETVPKNPSVGTPWEWGQPYSLSPNGLDPNFP